MASPETPKLIPKEAQSLHRHFEQTRPGEITLEQVGKRFEEIKKNARIKSLVPSVAQNIIRNEIDAKKKPK